MNPKSEGRADVNKEVGSFMFVLKALAFGIITVIVLCGIIIVTQPWEEFLSIPAEKARRAKELANSLGPATIILLAWVMLFWLFFFLLR